MTTYPGTLDTFTTKVDTTDDVLAADINALQAAIVALETELGTLPKGAYADVKARLAALATPSAPLTPSSLHATWGDHFTGASLDAKWSRQTYVSGDETYQAGGGSFLQVSPRAAGAYYYQASTGIGSSFSLVGKFIVQSTHGTNAFGLMAADSSGNGGAVSMYTSGVTTLDSIIALRISAGVFNTTFTQGVVTGAGTVARAGTPYWLRLNYASGVITGQYSLNGSFWSDTTPTLTPPGFTLARVGFGGVQGTVSKVGIDWFDVQ